MCDSAKPVLHYLNGRGRMESIRWLLAAVDVEFEEKFIYTKEDYEKLLRSGALLFQQVPMVEIDGMKMVQTRAILNYIAAKYNIYGRDIRERACIDMYVEGTIDLMTMILSSFFLPVSEKDARNKLIKDRALHRYFPVYEKALESQEYLVGNHFSLADVHLFETMLAVEEIHGDILQDFPNLQTFKSKIAEMPTIKKFMEPGSQRKPIADAAYISNALNVLF